MALIAFGVPDERGGQRHCAPGGFLLVLLLSLLLTRPALAAPSSWQEGLLEAPAFGRPFVSEIHSPLLKVELGYSKSYSEFNLQEDSKRFDRPVVEAHIGALIPLLAWDSGPWSFGAVLPIHVHVLEDMFESITAPVINTDYRFGGPRLGVMRRLGDRGLIRNVSFTWLPVSHECTHLGDEITLYRKDAQLPITRINVSYEVMDFQLTLNDPADLRETLHSLRLGTAVRLSHRGQGWFEVRREAEVAEDLQVADSEHRLESYAEYQLQRTEGFLASCRAVNVLSVEARYRLRYGYPMYRLVDGVWTTKEVQESMQWTFNVYLGWKLYTSSADQRRDPRGLGLYFHFYRGINPYGQLRNYPAYPFFGLSLTYDT